MSDQLEFKYVIRTEGTEQLDKLVSAVEAIKGALVKTEPALTEHEKHLKEISRQNAETAESIKKFGESIRQHIETPVGSVGFSLGKLAEQFGVVGIAATATAGVLAAAGLAAFESAKKLGELGTQISNISIRTGLSTVEVGRFSFAAKAAGSDISSFETAMRMLSRGLSDNSDEGKKTREEFERLGIKTKDVYNNLLPMNDIFLKISDSLNAATDTASRNSIALNLLGRAGLELVPTLMKLRENLELAKDANVETFSPAQVEQMEQYHKKVLLIEDAWSKVWHAIARVGVETAIALGTGSGAGGRPQPDQSFDPATGRVRATPREAPASTRNALGDFLNHTPTEMETQVSIGIGQSRIGTAQAERDRTKAGVEENLKTAQANEAAAFAAFTGSKGSVDSVVKPLEEAWHKAAGEAAKYKAQLDAIKKSEEDLKKLQELEKAAGEAGFSSTARETRRFAPLLQGNASQQAAFNAMFGRLSAKGLEEAQKKGSAERLKEIEEQEKMDQVLAQTNREDVKRGEKFPFGEVTAPGPPGASFQQQLRAVSAGGGAQTRAAGLQTAIAGGGPEAQARAELQIRQQIAGLELNIELQKAAAQKLQIERDADKYNAIFEYEEKLKRIREDNELRILEMRAQEREQARSTSGGFFDAMVGGNLPGFFKAQGLGIARTIFQNATTDLFNTNLSVTKDPNSGLGKFFANTPFGAKPGDMVTQSHTTAMAAHTLALNLAASRGGIAVTGGVSSAGGGSFASSIPAIFGGTPLGGGGGGNGDFGGETSSPNAIGSPGFMASLSKFTGSFGKGGASVLTGKAVPTLFSSSAGGAEKAGAAIGLAGAAYAGVTQAVRDFSQGGARGVIGGIGAVAGTAAAFDPEPISHAVLAGVALGASVISSLFGDPKAARTASIGHELTNAQFSTRGSIDEHGNFVAGRENKAIGYFGSSTGDSYDYNFRGGLRSGSQADTSRNTFDPSPNANQPKNGGVTINVTAMDSKSFLDHASDISAAVRKGVQQGHPLIQELQATLLPS